MNTDTQLIGAAAEAFLRLGAASVTVAEGQVIIATRNCFFMRPVSPISSLHRKIPFVDLNRDELVKTKLQANYSGLGHLWLPRTVLASDFIVSMPKVKTHHWTGVTLSMKNMFGIVPGSATAGRKMSFTGPESTKAFSTSAPQSARTSLSRTGSSRWKATAHSTAPQKTSTRFCSATILSLQTPLWRVFWDRNQVPSSISEKQADSLAIIKESFFESCVPIHSPADVPQKGKP